ncbi:MAG TPA: TRAP transporter small permease [Sandaracinaceae bacterium LLY-WYZ-13_1]|nr:TRAP transporter small permease [Sandaracinaceae bacterium LLY-WYZ-13_1]
MRRFAVRISKVVTKLEELCLAWGILGIAVLTIANVIARSLFGTSIVFAEEISQFLIVFVTFLGLGYAAGQGRHIRMTALYDQLPDKPRKALATTIAATTAALLFYLSYLAVRYALFTVRELGSVSPALRVPLWYVYLAAPLGFGLAGIQYVLALVKNLTTDGVWLSFEKEDGYDEAPPADI